MITAADIERFRMKIERGDSCWLWTAAIGGHGYGEFKVNGQTVTAHRFAYEMAKGPVPEGLDVDHICRNKHCVNPDHLRASTRKQNMENLAREGRGRSGVRGVYWDAARGLWGARVGHNYRTVFVGRFTTVEDAAEAVRLARLQIFTHNSTDRIPA